MKKLNLGCGIDIREGWVNLDCVALDGVDVIHDLSLLPLPFSDEIFSEILCKDVLEHVSDYALLLGELNRILVPGGRLVIRVPHFTSKDAYGDPTHRRFFTVNTLQYFVRSHLRSYYSEFHFSRSEAVHVYFDKRLVYCYNWFIDFFVNYSKSFQNLYEGSPLRIFPATNISITLIK